MKKKAPICCFLMLLAAILACAPIALATETETPAAEDIQDMPEDMTPPEFSGNMQGNPPMGRRGAMQEGEAPPQPGMMPGGQMRPEPGTASAEGGTAPENPPMPPEASAEGATAEADTSGDTQAPATRQQAEGETAADMQGPGGRGMAMDPGAGMGGMMDPATVDAWQESNAATAETGFFGFFKKHFTVLFAAAALVFGFFFAIFYKRKTY